MKAPGSPSSALQTTIFSAPFALKPACHLAPTGKPPPPRPRRPEALISWITCSRVIAERTFASAW